MSTSRSSPPGSVPTLTEVVPWPSGEQRRPTVAASIPSSKVPSSGAPLRPAPADLPAASVTPPADVPWPEALLPTEDELAKRVIGDLQRQIDLMLDVRLKEALAPILTRATDALVRDVRNQLATTLRDVVTRAVAKEMSRPPRK